MTIDIPAIFIIFYASGWIIALILRYFDIETWDDISYANYRLKRWAFRKADFMNKVVVKKLEEAVINRLPNYFWKKNKLLITYKTHNGKNYIVKVEEYGNRRNKKDIFVSRWVQGT